MNARRTVVLVTGVAITVAIAACAGARVVDGVFQSPKGYRVALPADQWSIVRGVAADLELRQATQAAGIVVNATCRRPAARASFDVLERHLLIGFRNRSVLSDEMASLNGKAARHSVLDGRLGDRGEPMRVEVYIVRGTRCVYDLLYAAPPASFEEWRPDFQRLVETFRAE